MENIKNNIIFLCLLTIAFFYLSMVKESSYLTRKNYYQSLDKGHRNLVNFAMTTDFFTPNE